MKNIKDKAKNYFSLTLHEREDKRKNKNLSPLHKNEKKISEKHFFVGAP